MYIISINRLSKENGGGEDGSDVYKYEIIFLLDCESSDCHFEHFEISVSSLLSGPNIPVRGRGARRPLSIQPLPSTLGAGASLPIMNIGGVPVPEPEPEPASPAEELLDRYGVSTLDGTDLKALLAAGVDEAGDAAAQADALVGLEAMLRSFDDSGDGRLEGAELENMARIIL